MDRDEANYIMTKRKIDPAKVDEANELIADMAGGRRAQARVAFNWLLRNPMPKPEPVPEPKPKAKTPKKKAPKSITRKS